MKKPPRRRISKIALPPWIPVVVIALIVVIIVAIFVRSARRDQIKLTRKQHAQTQELINRGILPPGVSRERLKELGFKLPPNFDELAAQATQHLPNTRARPGGRSPRGAAGSVE